MKAFPIMKLNYLIICLTLIGDILCTTQKMLNIAKFMTFSLKLMHFWHIKKIELNIKKKECNLRSESRHSSEESAKVSGHKCCECKDIT